MPTRRMKANAIGIAGFAAAAAATVLAASTFASGNTQSAPPNIQPPESHVTPSAGEAVDTSKPWWYVPFLNAERNKPAVDVTINGVQVGPNARRIIPGCELGAVPMAAEDAKPLAINVRALRPVGGVLEHELATSCAGRPAAYEVLYTIAGDPAAGRFGGSLMIARYAGPPSYESSIPTDRWSAGSINGVPVAIARPILENGLGSSAVVWHSNGVTTVVSADGLTEAEVKSVAEELAK